MMELHDLAEDLPSKWTEIMAVAEKAFRAFAELDAVKENLLSRRMHNDKLIRDARRSRWMPKYLSAIDGATCIGCGRCFKVCSREVMHLHGIDDVGEILGPFDGEEDDFGGELNRMIMVVDSRGRASAAEHAPASAPGTARLMSRLTYLPRDRTEEPVERRCHSKLSNRWAFLCTLRPNCVDGDPSMSTLTPP